MNLPGRLSSNQSPEGEFFDGDDASSGEQSKPRADALVGVVSPIDGSNESDPVHGSKTLAVHRRELLENMPALSTTRVTGQPLGKELSLDGKPVAVSIHLSKRFAWEGIEQAL